MKVNKILGLFGIAFCFIFLVPYFYQFYYLVVKGSDVINNIFKLWPEVIWAFRNSVYQSVLSAILALCFGLLYALAFFRVRSKPLQRLFVIVLLLPSLIPSMFIILTLMPIFDLIGRGILPVVIAHTFIFSGFVSLQIINSIKNKCSEFVDACYISGVSRFQFVLNVVIPIIKKDLIYIGLIVLVAAFSSFSIPLVLGSIQTTGLEVLIFEKFKIEFNIQSAFLISSLQTLFLLFLNLLTVRKFQDSRPLLIIENSKYLSSVLALILFIFIHLFFAILYFYQIISGFKFLHIVKEVLNVAMKSLAYTVELALILAVLTFIILQLYIYLFEKKFLFRFFEILVLPSSTLIGLSSIFIFSFESKTVVLVIALTTMLLPWAIKIFIHPKLLSLAYQEQVSFIAGATRWQIYRFIRWPQIKNETIWSLSLIVLWAISDFSVTRIVLEKQETLSLVMYSLMSSYRLNQSIAVSILILSVGLIYYLFIYWGVNAIYKAIEKKI